MIPLFSYLLPLFIAANRVVAPVNNASPMAVAAVGLATVFGFGAMPIGLAAGPRYVPKWKKQACEIPAAQHPRSHYVCDEAGEVKCLSGWTGDLCDVPLCRKGCDPLQGYCRRPGECLCKLGFYGELCDKCIPLPGCQHGGCNVSFECACNPGWKGLFCSEPICDPDCYPSQGYCERPGECRCRVGWQGPKCKKCKVLPGCVHGTCQGPLECRCDPGWTGVFCQTPICAQGCSRENGGCYRPGTCRCKVGWTGPNCTECVPYPGCAHGTCRRPWECRCQTGWAGDLCEEKLTFCDHHSNICENNGTCISMTKEHGDFRCICPLGYAGRQCQIETVEPAIDLMPPMPQPQSNITVTLSSELTEVPKEQENIEENDEGDTQPPHNRTTATPIVNAHQGHFETKKKVTVEDDLNATTTIEPLGTILITDPPSTVEPSATAGKWPTESPTENPIIDSDADNEAY
ncbi:hypothetical protein PV325_003917 [Microctonus aethiopoides]|uniref:EGF-like domain-containing protein n=1 Tax=Microctonus aethiopoides TaxID=144406 RepID=A0AA39EWE0_9HYME|nr:hypothetical protein PV325_003917 [Microctonus aethiopoides]KAK0158642.1 hypothetical protein PV328_009619 [Microctonus aethiopoides]